MDEHIERTFVALKPDTVRRGIMGEILTTFEEAGFKVIGMKMVWADEEILQEHYSEHVDKDFYDRLEEYMSSGPVVAMVLEGVNAVKNVRKIVGETDPREASPATIRGRFAHMSFAHADESGSLHKNIIHASAEPEEAEEEIEIWFDEEELHSYDQPREKDLR
ncbi:MAG: nucleoside-diphosphate kinase [Candidatus Nanohaloarchaea archaeon]